MKVTIYIQDNCPHCDEIIIPEGLNIEKIYINRDDYSGYVPGQVPVIQHANMNFEGPVGINAILKIIDDARQGKYSK